MRVKIGMVIALLVMMVAFTSESKAQSQIKGNTFEKRRAMTRAKKAHAARSGRAHNLNNQSKSTKRRMRSTQRKAARARLGKSPNPPKGRPKPPKSRKVKGGSKE